MINSKYFLIIFFALTAFFKVQAADYYWVGGSGNWNEINHWRTTSGGNSLPSVIPGVTDNVFFDANSGFTASDKTITVNVIANCKNITFSGSAVAPTLTQSGSQTLNIYGSSVWQAGMGQINIKYIYYRHTGETKTITSNGVITGIDTGYVYFEEENSISLNDEFFASYIYHNAGTFNTNSNNVTISYNYVANSGSKPRTINLGSSIITLKHIQSYFNTNSSNVTLNSGTSHIVFTNLNSLSTGYGIIPFANQIFYDITFERLGALGGTHSGTVYYNKVVFLGDGNLYGDNNFKSLIFSSSKTYTLPSSKTQTIVNLFSANTPQCGGWSTIKSSTAGTQANISAVAGVTIDVSGAIIQDVNATGGANFTANNSVDNSNNTGWTFPAYTGQDLYWVAGSGNWNDKAHWSQTSGGTGGYCVPGPGDNVFFDAGSGFTSTNKTVTVDNISYAHNVTFAGSAIAPTLTQSGTQTLNIYGSSVWQAGMGQINVANIYYRHTGEAKTITSNGVITGSNFSYVYFEEENSISLNDDFSVAYYLYHNAGTFNTNNYNVTIGYNFLANNGTKPRTINLGSSVITLTHSQSYFNTNSSNVTLNAGTSHIIFTLLNYTSASYGIVPYTNQVYYDVTFQKQGAIGGSHSGVVYYNNVVFLGDGNLYGDNNFKSLIFSPSKTYTLPSGKTQTIVNLFSANTPQCGGWSTIKSSTAGTQANISAATGVTIDVSGIIIQDVNATGGANFTANNSVDNSNNTGWIFPAYTGQDLYWVGGSGNWNDKAHWSQTSGGTGGYCVPGPGDNVFFDAGSGFTSTNKTVTVDNISYAHNVTFAGSAVAPTLTQSGSQTLNIYGSSVWQSGMGQINVNNIYYRHTGEAKTITSNGVITGSNFSYVYFEEENSISLNDDFSVAYYLYHNAGTFNTNNYNVTIGYNFLANNGTKPRTINLGSSVITLTHSQSYFNTNSSNVTLNSGTSHIIFTSLTNSTSSYGIVPYTNQVFNDVTFEKQGAIGGSHSGIAYYNHVIFRGNGGLWNDNNIKSLFLNAGMTYTFASNKTQTIDDLIIGGNPCNITYILSNTIGTQAKIQVLGSTVNFNFVSSKDINNIGQTIYFGEQSTNLGNNTNIIFDPYNPGGFDGLGADLMNYTIDTSNPSSYLISTSAFYGNAYTTYKWYKLNSTTPDNVINTTSSLDLRVFGHGFYKVQVFYSDGITENCTVSDTIKISPKLLHPVMVNPNLRVRVNNEF